MLSFFHDGIQVGAVQVDGLNHIYRAGVLVEGPKESHLGDSIAFSAAESLRPCFCSQQPKAPAERKTATEPLSGSIKMRKTNSVPESVLEPYCRCP